MEKKGAGNQLPKKNVLIWYDPLILDLYVIQLGQFTKCQDKIFEYLLLAQSKFPQSL